MTEININDEKQTTAKGWRYATAAADEYAQKMADAEPQATEEEPVEGEYECGCDEAWEAAAAEFRENMGKLGMKIKGTLLEHGIDTDVLAAKIADDAEAAGAKLVDVTVAGLSAAESVLGSMAEFLAKEGGGSADEGIEDDEE